MTNATREHRAEAARLLGFEPAPSGWHLNVLAHRWVEGEPVPEWWLTEREQGAMLPLVAQALADRDARIGELLTDREKLHDECAILDSALHEARNYATAEYTRVSTQLARVVELLRESYDELMTDGGCTVTHKIEQFFQETEDHA